MFDCTEEEPQRFCKGCGKELDEGVYSYCNSQCMMARHTRAKMKGLTPKRFDVFEGLPKMKHGVRR